MFTLNVEISLIIPLLSLSFFTLAVLLIEAFVRESEFYSYYTSVAGIAATAVACFISVDIPRGVFYNMLVGGGFANFVSGVLLTAATLTIIFSREYLRKLGIELGEFYLMILFSSVGMMIMVSAADLIVLFLGLELMSVSLYVLAGYYRKKVTSNESALKYFLLGAFATGFLLYGIALLYGTAGTTNISTIVASYLELSHSLMFWTGLGLLLVGFAFKVAAVPFHMWVPDVYEGSPTPVTGFMSTGAKTAAFGAMILVFARDFFPDESLRTLLAVLSAASMILGNVVAISQTNIKRMLAYSSIAHAGYMLAGIAASNALGRAGVIYYLVVYTLMNVGAFGIISLLEDKDEKNLNVADYAGLGARRPALAALMAVFMFSLAGIPPFGGFFGKYYVFAGAVSGGMTWLALLGVLTSLIGVYYYLRIVVLMYFQEGNAVTTPRPAFLAMLSLIFSAGTVLYLGVVPSSVLSVINRLF